MLVEIKCDKFKVQPQCFTEGLNIITGSDDGGNSIGKTTFLMIIDYVFGGEDYITKSDDVQKNIGEHNIYFKFIFSGKNYYFCRNTFENRLVYRCDENYNRGDSIPLEKYNNFLKKMYGLSEKDLSFRDEISRFLRIYGRDNLQERRPLHMHPAEKISECINILLKLFDKFKPIAELEEKYGHLQKKKKAFDEANKYSLIERISKPTYKKNVQEIQQISNQIDKILQDMDHGLSDLNSTITEEVLTLKEELSRLKISRSRNQHEKNKLTKYNSENVSQEQYAQLERFFPGINLKDIKEIEAFHESLKIALNDEINEERNRYEIIIGKLDQQISFIELQIKERSAIQSLSKSVLLQLTKLQKRQETLIKQNKLFDEYSLLRESIEDLNNRIQEVKQCQVNEIQAKINIEMEKINDFIYNGQNKSPLLTIGKTNYSFVTPDDSGTGTSYKSMIVYDLAIMNLTDLPVLIHDSYLLKQIQDIAIERILELYLKTNKQVFISIDKVNSLTQRTQDIVSEKECLHLYPNGGELFGKSWNKKKD